MISIKKVIIPLWSTSGRDFQIVMPIAYYLEKFRKCEVKVISMWDWYTINKFKPDLVLFSNTVGAVINFRFLKYLKNKNYKVISLVSEGNYNEKDIHEFVWGWNKEKILHEDKNLLWSERCRNLTLKYFPELEPKISVSGAVGFDRYKIYPFMKKEYFLEKYNLNKYSKVIGYAGWGFDMFQDEGELKNAPQKVRDYLDSYRKNYVKEDKFELYLQVKKKINQILRRTIENNPDILFILKLHPGTVYDDKTEMKNLDYENVILLKYEEEISDLINVCDIWTAFNSTTSLEAWLLDKPTVNLCPLDFEYERNLNMKGSVDVYEYEPFQRVIDEFYSTGSIKAFEEKKNERRDVIEQIIQWDDGLNHVRAGEEIAKLIDDGRRPEILKDGTLTRLRLFAIHLLVKYSRFFDKMGLFKEKNIIFHQVSQKEIQEFKDKYYSYLDKFHENKALDETNIR